MAFPAIGCILLVLVERERLSTTVLVMILNIIKIPWAEVAQQAERDFCKVQVAGSIPSFGFRTGGGMADAAGLGPVAERRLGSSPSLCSVFNTN